MAKKIVPLFSVAALLLLALASFAPAKAWLSDEQPRIIFDGDSLTYGFRATKGDDYPSVVMRGTPSSFHWHNFAVSGQTLAQMQGDAAEQLDRPYAGFPHKTLIAWGGVNDIYHGANAATVYERLLTYARARKAAGWRVYVLTVLPFGPGSLVPAAAEAERTTINDMIRANWRQFSDGLIDIASDNRIGAAGDETSPIYYNPDHLHLSDAGYAVVAEDVKRALAADHILP